MSEIGSDSRPLRVAIIGSGPSGFYAAAALFKSDVPVHVAVFEKLPVPFGLVRFGVAPDHGKIRNVIKTYQKTAANPDFSFWGNVNVGEDVSIEELQRHFDAIILAYGSATDRQLGIPGEDLPRSYTATAFCSWYNGHPEFADMEFDLSQETAVVIGQGNVAMDVCRILATDADELAKTDMASHAVSALRESKVKTIHCVGRRGPVQAAFTPKEIKELGEIAGCDCVVRSEDLDVGPNCLAELELPDRSSSRKNFEVMKELAEQEPSGANRQIVMHFLRSPVAIEGEGGVQRTILEHNQLSGDAGSQKARGTGEKSELDCGLFFRSVGYRGMPLAGIPFNDDWGVVPNEGGRVEPGLYAVGWIKRGPSGLIGTNNGDSADTVKELLADVPKLTPAPEPDDDGLMAALADRGVRVVTYDDWLKIDKVELERGASAGKPRDNFIHVEEMLSVLD